MGGHTQETFTENKGSPHFENGMQGVQNNNGGKLLAIHLNT